MFRRQLVMAAAAFLVVAALALWVLRPQPGPETEPYFALSRAIPDTLTVAAEDTTVLVREGQEWRVLRPVSDAADGVAVEALVKRLRHFEVDRILPHDPAQEIAYGLMPPQCLIIAGYREGPPDSLCLGYPNAASPKIYVRRGYRGDVGLVAKHIPETYFMKPVAEWRSPFLLPVHESVITAFGFRGAHPDPVGLARGPAGDWRVTEPYPGPADGDYVFEVLKTFTRLEIMSFRDGETRVAFTDSLVGWARTEEGDSLWIALGPPFHADSSLARVAGRSADMVVASTYRSFFSQPAQAFRDTRLFRTGWAVVDSLVLRPSGTRRSRDDWGSDPSGHLAKYLRSFLKLEAEGFAEATPENTARLTEAEEMLLYVRGELLVGMRFGPWGVSQTAFWLDRGPGARRREIFLLPRDVAEALIDAFRESDS